MRIVFMGTPDFAASSLKALIDNNYDVVAVFSQPDKAKNRGMKTVFSEVKTLALEHDLPVFQPESLRNGVGKALMDELAADIMVVVAYGKILPEDMLNSTKYGAINVHGSILPQYRGAAPIQWSVLNGDKITGVTTMYLSKGMDEGDIIFTDETEIGELETAGELFDRLADMGAKLLCKTLDAIEDGTAPRQAQEHDKATYVGQLSKDISPIDFTKTPREVIKHICGLNPWPVATMNIHGETYKVFEAKYSDNKSNKPAGSVVSTGKDGIEIACGDGSTVYITQLQLAGKKRMAAADFLRGHKVEVD